MAQTSQEAAGSLSSPYLQSFLSDPPIGEQLPALTKVGENLTMPAMRCDHCHGSVSETMVRGTLKRIKPWLVSVQAGAFCARCQVISPVRLRLHSRGAVDLYTKGKWITREPAKTPQYRLVLADKSRGFAQKVRNACDVKRFVLGFAGKERT